MNIRSVTLFVPSVSAIATAGIFAREARSAFESEGLSVQTVRIATPPFPSILEKPEGAIELARQVERAMGEAGFDYASLGPGMGKWIDAIPDMLASTKKVFASAVIATHQAGIDFLAVRRAATAIRKVAAISPDGFGNLRMGALCNVSSCTPFFPAAYHDAGPAAFAIATEAADLAVTAFEASRSVDEARHNLRSAVKFHADQIVSAAQSLSRAHGIRFAGIDFSLAPFPEERRSIGRALELLTGAPIGSPGALAAAAMITRIIESVDFARCGFCGLMLPVLEDAVLAQRAAEGTLTLGDLLHYSAVCGTGLDTIPLPGDISEETLAGILLDVASVAWKWNKPLTARLMPLPGKKAGDSVHFDFPWFANSRVMKVPGDEGKPRAGLFFRSFPQR